MRLTTALFVQVKVIVGGQNFAASSLVDTGAIFPIILGRGLLPEQCLSLSQCAHPDRLVDTSGAAMKGGTRGVSVRIALPVVDDR